MVTGPPTEPGTEPIPLPRRPAAMADLQHARVDATFNVTYNITGTGANGGVAQFLNGGMFGINGRSFTATYGNVGMISVHAHFPALPRRPHAPCGMLYVRVCLSDAYRMLNWCLQFDGVPDSRRLPWLGVIRIIRPKHCMLLGSVLEWTVHHAHNPLDRWMHSFHIHVNNFPVVHRLEGIDR